MGEACSKSAFCLFVFSNSKVKQIISVFIARAIAGAVIFVKILKEQNISLKEGIERIGWYRNLGFYWKSLKSCGTFIPE